MFNYNYNFNLNWDFCFVADNSIVGNNLVTFLKLNMQVKTINIFKIRKICMIIQ